jgi:hypothetical protein
MGEERSIVEMCNGGEKWRSIMKVREKRFGVILEAFMLPIR